MDKDCSHFILIARYNNHIWYIALAMGYRKVYGIYESISLCYFCIL